MQATPVRQHRPFEYFPKIWIVNLPERTDRRRAMIAEIERLGLSMTSGEVEVVDAVRPTEPGGFPSVGARGCFESHHALIKRARSMDLPRVLILEDDAEVVPGAASGITELIDELSDLPWDMAYFGHTAAVRSLDPAARWVRFRRGVETTHAYALSADVLPALDEYLDRLRERPSDHPDGGPMHVDGAYSDFRVFHPEVRTYLAAPSVIRQRSSASDIHPRRLDTLGLPPQAVAAARYLRRHARRLVGR